jgi:hypothetical protein
MHMHMSAYDPKWTFTFSLPGIITAKRLPTSRRQPFYWDQLKLTHDHQPVVIIVWLNALFHHVLHPRLSRYGMFHCIAHLIKRKERKRSQPLLLFGAECCVKRSPCIREFL